MFGVIGVMLCFLAAVIILLYYKRRIKKIKQDVRVHYKANSGSGSGKLNE